MSSFTSDNPRDGYLVLHGEMTIDDAGCLKQLLLEQLSHVQSLELDLLNVTRIDTSFVQLLLLVQREAELHQKELVLSGFSVVVEEALDVLGLNTKLVPAAVLWS